MSFTISYLFHLGERVGWLLRGGPAKLSQLKLWHYFEQGRSGKGSLGYGLACGLPLHVFVCCRWGGRVVHLRA